MFILTLQANANSLTLALTTQIPEENSSNLFTISWYTSELKKISHLSGFILSPVFPHSSMSILKLRSSKQKTMNCSVLRLDYSRRTTKLKLNNTAIGNWRLPDSSLSFPLEFVTIYFVERVPKKKFNLWPLTF